MLALIGGGGRRRSCSGWPWRGCSPARWRGRCARSRPPRGAWPAGDLDARAEPEGSSEQREVAAAFNDMTGRLGRSLLAQREFVANASHQLRTPLTGLRLRLEAAELKSGDPEVKRELAAAERETERLADLLGQLLSLAREPEREDRRAAARSPTRRRRRCSAGRRRPRAAATS